jgi:hypothetical protein
VEIRLRAERKAGQILKEMKKAKGELRRSTTAVPRGDEPRLADLGVSKKQSSEAR